MLLIKSPGNTLNLCVFYCMAPSAEPILFSHTMQHHGQTSTYAAIIKVTLGRPVVIQCDYGNQMPFPKVSFPVVFLFQPNLQHCDPLTSTTHFVVICSCPLWSDCLHPCPPLDFPLKNIQGSLLKVSDSDQTYSHKVCH